MILNSQDNAAAARVASSLAVPSAFTAASAPH